MSSAADRPFDRPLDSVLETQVAALLQRLERHRHARCRTITEDAEARAREIESQAWHEAAERGRAAVRTARSELEEGRQRLQAAFESQQRQRAQAEARRRLGELWKQLPGAMQKRWQVPAQRRAWLAAALQLADHALTPHAWLIEYAADLSGDELLSALESAGFSANRSIRMRPAEDITAGIRISAEGARFDATIRGLLADKARIEAAFLAQCELGGSTDACGILVEPDRA